MTLFDVGYRRLARPLLFAAGQGDAETAHARTLAALARISARPALLAGLRRLLAAGSRPPVPCRAFGLDFPSPVGLAAGVDKDGLALAAWPAMGFGFVEAGTVTAVAQPGNDRPRVFRLTESEAVINRMGFPNAGATALAARARRAGNIGVPLGISLGKSKIVSPDDVDAVITDYLTSLRAVASYADYIAVNVSSPNTPGLRGLQDRGALDALLAALVAETRGLAERFGGRDARSVSPDARGSGDDALPLLVKIAPDMDEHAIDDVLDVCHERGVAGVIATNTTVARPGLAPGDRGLGLESGGLSGRPLAARALEVVRFVRRHTDLPVIGVGGISSPDDARAMVDAGATLVQLYTGLLYGGPALVRAIAGAAPTSPRATQGE